MGSFLGREYLNERSGREGNSVPISNPSYEPAGIRLPPTLPVLGILREPGHLGAKRSSIPAVERFALFQLFPLGFEQLVFIHLVRYKHGFVYPCPRNAVKRCSSTRGGFGLFQP